MPAALLCAASGLALSFAPKRMGVTGLGTIAVAAIFSATLPWPGSWIDAAFFGCWISLAVTAAAVHLPGGPGERAAIGLSLNVGIWSGAVIALAGTAVDLAPALTAMFVMLPATRFIARGMGIAVKIASSWLIAIALLAATLQMLPVTPGYLPDHLE